MLILLGGFHETAVRWRLEPPGGSNWHLGRQGHTPRTAGHLSAFPCHTPICVVSPARSWTSFTTTERPQKTDRRRNCQASLPPVLRTPVKYRFCLLLVEAVRCSAQMKEEWHEVDGRAGLLEAIPGAELPQVGMSPTAGGGSKGQEPKVTPGF